MEVPFWADSGVACSTSQADFVLSSSGETLLAYGASEVFTCPLAQGLAEKVSASLKDAARGRGAPGIAVGALPFDSSRAAHLTMPDRVRRLSRGTGLEWEPIDAWSTARSAGSAAPWEVSAEPNHAEYEHKVERALALLSENGKSPALRKVVLARSLVLRTSETIEPARLVSRLCSDPSVTTFAVNLPPFPGEGERTLIGATPELLIEKKGRNVLSGPLAGSAPRDVDAARDRAAAEALLRSEKDLREHASVVEWIADRLAPYCRRLSIPASPDLVSTRTLWHLSSKIEGELYDPDLTSLHLTGVIHPTPAVCGFPRDAADATIAELESFDRGFFAGAVGWCDSEGDGRWMVTIRCAELSGSTARLYAGAGIVKGSEPRKEAIETSAKFAAMLRALGIDEEGHTLRGDDR